MYIIKVLIALYQKHFQMIKEMKIIPFWVKCLANEKHFSLHFWILQLIYVALSIPFAEYANANFKLFKKANGLTAIFGILNTTFKEMTPPDIYELEEEKSDHFNAKISNFTGIKENLYYFERNSMHINKGIIVINILDVLHTLMGDASKVPLPSLAQYLCKKRSINVMTQLFFIENADLNKVLINFILKN